MKAVAKQSKPQNDTSGKQQTAPDRPAPHADTIASSLANPVIQRKANCACGGDCPRCQNAAQTLGVQTKLAISTPGDTFEQEADRVSEQVMRTPESTATPRIQPLKTGAGHNSEGASNLTSRLGTGMPLDTASRSYFEPRFGHDFGDVRVHAGSAAATAAASVQARAFTIGHDVVFAAGEHNPASEGGKRLLAHELTHVVQQGGGAAAGQASQAISASPSLALQRAPGDASPYPEEDTVLRAVTGERDAGRLANGAVVYNGKGWQAVGLSEAAFVVGPFSSDMGTIFYVYRFEGARSPKTSRVVHLAGWNAKITPELRDQLEKGNSGNNSKPAPVTSPGSTGSTGTTQQPAGGQSSDKKNVAIPDQRTAPPLPQVWTAPTDAVVQAWMYNQIDNWHTGAIQGLGNFKDAIKKDTSVGFWLGLAGNVTWALGAFGAPPVAVAVGLIGVAMGTIGSAVQSHADKSEADRVDAIYQDFLKGFNDSRSQMGAEVIQDANAIVATADFKNAVATRSTVAWQAVVRKLANMPEGQNIDQISKNTERNLYNIYLKDRGSFYSRDIFHVESPNHPGFESEEKNLWLHNVPDKVRARLTAIGVDWKRIYELPIPYRDRHLYRRSGTVGAIQYWDYDERTAYPPGWTQADIAEFLKKAPSYVGQTSTGTTH